MHALIIEDDGLIALHLEMLLGELGFESFAWAATEAAAVDAARERCPDLVTADLHLRAGDGRAAVGKIHERCPTPVIYVTGNPHELDDVPAALVVAKPFDGDRLHRAIDAARAAPRRGGQGRAREP